MRRIIVMMSVSVDGFIEGPDWNATVVREVVPEEVLELKRRPRR